jgi:hypothetical protein
MLRALTAILFIGFVSGACTQRMICPAYQSAFIYDKDALRKKFSYIKEDSTPKIYTASKTKYLIAEPVSYRKKIRMMQTVAMRPVNVVLPDSLKPLDERMLAEDGEFGVDPGSELDRAARSVIDSTYIEDVPLADPALAAQDSIYVISKDKETRVLKYNFPDSLVYDENSGRYVSQTPRYAVVHVTFNVDQDNYMWYLRDYLVLPDVRQSRVQQDARRGDEAALQKEAKKKKGVKGFFRNLFGRKKKDQPAEEAPPPRRSDEEEFDFIDEEPKEDQDTVEDAQPQKKGLFGKKKNKSKKSPEKPDETTPETVPPVQDPTEKKIPEKLDQDGF